MTDAPDNKTAKVTLQYVVDRASLNQVAQSTDSVRKDMIGLQVDTSRTTTSAQQLDDVMKQLGKGDIKGIVSQYKDIGQVIKDDTEAARLMNEALKQAGASQAQIGQANAGFSGADTGAGTGAPAPDDQPDGGGSSRGIGLSTLRTTGRALDRIGLGDIGQPIQQLGALGIVARTLGEVATTAGIGVTATGVAIGGLNIATGPLILAVGAVAAVIGVVTILQSNYNAEMKKQEEALKELLDAQQKYNVDIHTLTTEGAKKALEDAKNTRRSANDTIGDARNIINQRISKEDDAAFLKTLPPDRQDTLLRSRDNFKTLFDTIDKAQTTFDTSGVSIDLLTNGIKNNAFAVQDAIAAEKKLQDARDQNAEKAVDQAKSDAKLIATGTSKGVEEQLGDIKAAKKAIDDLDFKKLSPEEALKLTKDWNDLTDTETDLTNNVLPLIKAREAETAAEKDALKAAQDKLKADEKQQQDSVATLDKYNTAVQSAEDSAAQARINANGKLQDALVKAAQDAVDKSTAALAQLEQKRADNLTSLDLDLGKQNRASGDQQIEDQIKAQRQERDDLQTHLDNLKQIRDADAGRLRDDLLNRNFRDAFALGEQKNQDAAKENERFTEQQQKRNQALDDQGADEARAQVIQRRERLISYQNANQDALKQYNIELQQAAQAKARAIQQDQQGNAKELATINSSLITKEALLKQGAINDIKLVQQTEDQKQAIFLAKLEQVNQLLGIVSAQNALPSQHTGSRAVLLAGGGDLAAGQRAIVNEPGSTGNESFNGVPFPKSMGLFIPLKSGNVNPGRSGGGDINIPITVNEASTPAATAAAIRPMVIKIIREVGRH